MGSNAQVQLAPRPGSRVAVVGGSGAIGRALVAAACESDLQVAVLDLPSSLEAHPPPPGCLRLSLDASVEEQTAAAFANLADQWPGLEGLVNLVGFSDTPKPVEDFDLDSWQRIIDGNLSSAFLISKYGLNLLRDGREPALVHVSSALGVRATAGYGPYSIAKAGILGLVRMLARESAPWLRVNAVAPSAVQTEFLTGGTGRAQRPGHLDVTAYAQQIPLGRIAVPDDIVGPVLFLLSPAAGYVSGQTLLVNGGLF